MNFYSVVQFLFWLNKSMLADFSFFRIREATWVYICSFDRNLFLFTAAVIMDTNYIITGFV